MTPQTHVAPNGFLQTWVAVGRPLKFGIGIVLFGIAALAFLLWSGSVKFSQVNAPTVPSVLAPPAGTGGNGGASALAPVSTVQAQTPPAGTVTTTTVSLSGEGTITAKPDLAHISVGVQVRDKTVSSVQSQAAASLSKIIAAAKAKGIADSDIETTGYSIQADYDYSKTGPPSFIGYVLNSTLQITVHGIDKDKTLAGGVLDAVTGAGANIVGGITFDVADTTALRNQAIAAAMNDARAKADQLAAAGKFTIVGVNSVTETGAPHPVPMGTQNGAVPAASGGTASTPIQNGTFNYTYTVQVSFSIS